MLIPRSGRIVFWFPLSFSCFGNMATNIIVVRTKLMAQQHLLNVLIVYAWVQSIRSRHGNTLARKDCVWGIVWGIVDDYLL